MIKHWLQNWKERRMSRQLRNMDRELLMRRLKLGRYEFLSDHTNDICIKALSKKQVQLLEKYRNYYNAKKS